MNVTRQFVKYVSQNIFGMLGISCYIIVDTFFISEAAGTNGITVLNLVLPVYNLIFAIGSMIGVGSATRFAILRAQKEKSADTYFTNAILCILILSLVFIAAGIFAPDAVLRMMGGDDTIVALGVDYTRIFLLFTPFFMMNYVFSAFVRNDNAPSLAMIATMAGSLSNIVFDYVFMFPMGMGLAGAALATAASPVISILICSIHFSGKNNTIHFRPAPPSFRMLVSSCQLGVSAFVGELSSGVTTAVFNFLILGLVGNVGVAAYGVIANYALIFTCIFNGISQGAQPLVSEYYGKGDRRSVRRILHLDMCTAFTFSALILAGAYFFTEPLVAIFNSENSVKMADYALEGMRLYVIGFLFAGFNIVGTGFLSAAARAKEAFASSICRGFIAIIFCSFVLSQLFGLRGVWLAFAASEFLTVWITAWALVRSLRLMKETESA